MAIRKRALENLDVNQSFWRDKTVFITGHTGFKGSWLSLWLQKLGAKVVGFSLSPPSKPNLFSLAQVAKDMVSIEGNVENITHLRQTLEQYQPDLVFHMAAQSLVQHSYRYPLETYHTNIIGTLNILEAIRGLQKSLPIVNVTSDKCYENRECNTSYTETEPLGGYDPYSNSKACADLVASAYRRSYEMPIASVRAGNVIGGGDWASNRLIPDIMMAFAENKPVKIRHANAIRPWQFVLEPLRGYLMLAERLWDNPKRYADAWNFGPIESDVRPVHFIVDRLVQLWGEQASWIKDTNSFAHEAQTLRLNIDKAKSQLDWTPKLNIEDSLNSVVSWYKAWHDKKDMRAVTLAQLEEYMGY